MNDPFIWMGIDIQQAVKDMIEGQLDHHDNVICEQCLKKFIQILAK